MRVKVLKNVFTPAPVVENKPAKGDKMIVHTDIRNKWEIGKALDHSFNAEINLTKKSIRIYGSKERYGRGSVKQVVSFDRTFGIGDLVEYGSYNLTYTDPIAAITPQGVKIDHHGRFSIMKLVDFIGRNYDLDLQAIAEKNAAWMD